MMRRRFQGPRHRLRSADAGAKKRFSGNIVDFVRSVFLLNMRWCWLIIPIEGDLMILHLALGIESDGKSL